MNGSVARRWRPVRWCRFRRSRAMRCDVPRCCRTWRRTTTRRNGTWRTCTLPSTTSTVPPPPPPILPFRFFAYRGASPPAAAAAKCLLGPHFQPAVHVPARFVRHGRVQPLSHHSSQQQQQRRRKRKQQQKETPKVSSGGRRLFRGGFRRCREWVIESAPEVAQLFPVTESRLEAFHGGTGRKWFETERFPEAGVVYFVEKVVPLPAVVKQ
uniref:(northern house mosquito) hypothetical protein n=1 Tax=Culex pipiens TaxID=7175 RepID=A0A8D8HE73_CULPI